MIHYNIWHLWLIWLSGKWCMVKKKHTAPTFQHNWELTKNTIHHGFLQEPLLRIYSSSQKVWYPRNFLGPLSSSTMFCPVLLLHVLLFPRKGLKGGDPLGVASSHIAILGYLPNCFWWFPEMTVDFTWLYLILEPFQWFWMSVSGLPCLPPSHVPSRWRFPTS